MKITHLLAIAFDYPSRVQPTTGTFVRQLTRAFVRSGVQVTVVHPIPLNRTWRGFRFRSIDVIDDVGKINVYQPKFLMTPARPYLSKLGRANPMLLSLHSFVHAVSRTVRKHHIEPDATYGHFMFPSGAAAVRIGQTLGIPAFPAFGESVTEGSPIWSIRPFGKTYAKSEIRGASGVIVNSTLLREMVAEQLELDPSRIGVFPNGTDLSSFWPRDRREMRTKYNLPENAFLVACVGQFSNRKGQQRVLEAVRPLDGVKVVFLGRDVPFSRQDESVAYNSPVSLEKVPEYLSACDCFVLPTLAEGCSNAIIEAMACGLPIVSSDRRFNHDILSSEVSILIDPENVSSIRQAIALLQSSVQQRRRMSQASLERAKSLDINQRAQNILKFMRSQTSCKHIKRGVQASSRSLS